MIIWTTHSPRSERKPPGWERDRRAPRVRALWPPHVWGSPPRQQRRGVRASRTRDQQVLRSVHRVDRRFTGGGPKGCGSLAMARMRSSAQLTGERSGYGAGDRRTEWLWSGRGRPARQPHGPRRRGGHVDRVPSCWRRVLGRTGTVTHWSRSSMPWRPFRALGSISRTGWPDVVRLTVLP